MVLIIGGRYQGKLAFARERFGLSETWFFGGWEKSLPFWHRRGDASECHPSFLRGVGCTSSPFLGAYRGKP